MLLACREMERLCQFGELVNISGKDNFKGHEEVLELLQIMMEDLGANVTEQQWYQLVQEVRCRGCRNPAGGAGGAGGAGTLQEVRCRVDQVDCTSCS